MKKIHITLLCLFLASVTYAQDQILGQWLTQDKDAIIEIYSKKDKYYGKIISLMPETKADGSPIIDEHNPSKSLRKRPVLGIDIIVGFDWDANNQKLVNGKVYDPNNGKSYKGKIWLEDGKLKMRGYVSVFYRTETWTRVK